MYARLTPTVARKPYREEEVIATYKHLIHRMPRGNQYLLLYVLDLLSVFARKSSKNLMTATSAYISCFLARLCRVCWCALIPSSLPVDLAVIFRPGLISHPNHELSPSEHHLSQQVLEFLIQHQDWFLLDIPPPPKSEPPPAWRPPRTQYLTPAPQNDEDPDLVFIPSSDDERPSTGGWKLVGQRRRITRRRTTHEHLGGLPSSAPARSGLGRR